MTRIVPLKRTSGTSIDIVFQAGSTQERLVDAAFSAMIENASGKKLSVAGFFDGDGQFVVRFTPPATGKWNYVTSSSIASLDELKGAVDVLPARDSRRGGIVVDSDSPREFRYQNGDVYYPIAFESDWLFALDAENADDIPTTRTLVDSLAENGFNQIVMNVFAYDVYWEKDPGLDPKFEYGSPKSFPFDGTNTDPDFSKLNIDYFQRLDRVIEYLDEKGIAAHLMVYVWNKRVNWPEANSEADNRYFDYVIKRYQAFPNLIWDVSKEALGYGHTDVDYISQRISRLRKLDAYQRLVTVHDYGYCKRFPELVDFISVQLWGSELFGVMRDVCDQFPGQPILNIEHGGYEKGPYKVFIGNYTSPEVCLERAYQCVFAGTFPTHYWQGAAWNVVIPDINAMSAESRPKLDYYKHMRDLVDRYSVSELKAGDKKSNSGFCLHRSNKDGEGLYLFYVPKENIAINLRFPKSMKGGAMTATWFNPFTGEYTTTEPETIPQWPAYSIPEGNGFRILIVETKSK